MITIAWTPKLSVGVEMIDSQHKMWFKKAEMFFEAGMNGQAKEYLEELLTFLEQYTKKHFADEEAYMLSIKYPEYREQKKAHAAFIAELAKLRHDFETSGGNLLVILNANQIVIDWLTKHISNMDKKIGQFVKTKQVK